MVTGVMRHVHSSTVYSVGKREIAPRRILCLLGHGNAQLRGQFCQTAQVPRLVLRLTHKLMVDVL